MARFEIEDMDIDGEIKVPHRSASFFIGTPAKRNKKVLKRGISTFSALPESKFEKKQVQIEKARFLEDFEGTLETFN
jgi:hypothetical protein